MRNISGELSNIRPSGLIVINLKDGDESVAVAQVGEGRDAMMGTEKGQGVSAFRVTEKAGRLAAARIVTDPENQEMLIISSKAQVVRISIDDVRETGRIAQGVILWKERESDDYVASVAVFQETERGGIGEPPAASRRCRNGFVGVALRNISGET